MSLALIDPRGPWSRRDLVIVSVLGAVALGGIAFSWSTAAGELEWRHQLRWISVGAVFTVVFVLAAVGWTVVGMRRVRHAARDVTRERHQFAVVDDVAEHLTVAVVLAGSSQLWTVAPMSRAHRPDCLLLRGKSPTAIPDDRVNLYTRCGVCRS